MCFLNMKGSLFSGAEQNIGQPQLENAVPDRSIAVARTLVFNIGNTKVITAIDPQSGGRDSVPYAKNPGKIGGFVKVFNIRAGSIELIMGGQ